MATRARERFARVLRHLDSAAEATVGPTRHLLLQIRQGIGEPPSRRSEDDEAVLNADASPEASEDAPKSPRDYGSRLLLGHLATDDSSTEPFVLGVWAHLDHQREEMLNRARHEQGEKLRVASRGPVPIRRRQDTELTAKLHIPAFSTQVEDTIEWSGEIGHVSFVLTAPVGQPRGPLTGSLVVYAGVLRLARLEFILEVGARSTAIHRAKSRERRVRRGFASYASDDRTEVLARIQGMQKIAPMLDVFVDALSLRS